MLQDADWVYILGIVIGRQKFYHGLEQVHQRHLTQFLKIKSIVTVFRPIGMQKTELVEFVRAFEAEEVSFADGDVADDVKLIRGII